MSAAAPTLPGLPPVARNHEFQQFAARSLPVLLRGAYLLLRDLDLAEDAVQETLLRIFRHWSQASTAPEAYGRVTLVNVCRDHWRRLQNRATEAPAASFEPATPEGTGGWEHALIEREALADALAHLATQQREVLILRFFLDFSVSETAEALGVAPGTVKSCTHRALQELRCVLASAECNGVRLVR